MKIIVFDIETYPNLFTFVGVDKVTGDVHTFIISDDLDQGDEFLKFLRGDMIFFVGYNNIEFDGQIVEHFFRGKIRTAEEIYNYAQDIMAINDSFKLPYKQWTFSHKHLDLMQMNHYGIRGSKTSSLKWLEFTTRQNSISDLPIPFGKSVTKKKIPSVVKYNGQDTDFTDYFYGLCKDSISMRKSLIKEYGDQLMLNSPNSGLGEKIMLYEYCKAAKKSPKEVKKLFTKREKVVIEELLLPYLKFKSPILNEVLGDFRKLVLTPRADGTINTKGGFSKTIDFHGCEVTYALGGIHGCVPPCVVESTDTHVIKTCDVASMYPNLAIANELHPEHLGKIFCKVYKELYKRRKTFPKGTDLNKALKEALNSVYGKSNAKHGFLRDTNYTMATTVNGQLSLSMLMEALHIIGGKILMINTDGIEVLLPRDKEDLYFRVCKRWEKLTGVELEHDEYEKMYIKDVNNYGARTFSGKTKRTGMMSIYEDYIGEWHMSPSGLIVPLSIWNYFMEGTDPEKTVKEHDNIHDFLYGVKGGGTTEYHAIYVNDDKTFRKIQKYTERAVRYYVATEGANLLKFQVTKRGPELGRIHKGSLVKPLQNIRKTEVWRKVKKDVYERRYADLNYEYYIEEAWRWISLMEG